MWHLSGWKTKGRASEELCYWRQRHWGSCGTLLYKHLIICSILIKPC